MIALDELEDCIPSDSSVEHEIEVAELAKAIDNFITSLPVTERRVFICRYWYLDPIAEICHQFGFSQSKVKSMLHRIRQKLLSYLIKEGFYYDNE